MADAAIDRTSKTPWVNGNFVMTRRTRRRRQRDTPPNSSALTSTTTPATSRTPSLPTSPTPKPTPRAPPKSWADLLRDQKKAQAAAPSASSQSLATTNGQKTSLRGKVSTEDGEKSHTLDILLSFKSTLSMPILKPRGLVNNGNMCYMNAILQILVYTPPFYNLLSLVGRHVAHSFKSQTPLMDALILYLHEFQALKPKETESWQDAYGDPFVPDYVYAAMKGNKRFDNMRKGRQEDAEEFLGLLLDELHEEFLAEIRRGDSKETYVIDGKVHTITLATNADASEQPSNNVEDGWMEVGRNNKTAYTRTTESTESPIPNIFGGKLRSVLRIPGSKDSVTLEPYQPLQLDIQPAHVRTIEDALHNLVVPEVLSDMWSPAKNAYTEATKQVYIETLPPILVVHLKRFLYDNVGGVQKSHKIIGYGTRLTIPHELISPARRPSPNDPVNYRLLGVVYHHGTSAAGGHYTADILRHDDNLSGDAQGAKDTMAHWINIDDTHIVPILEEDVRVKVATAAKMNGVVAAATGGSIAAPNNSYDVLDTGAGAASWATKAAAAPLPAPMPATNGHALHHLDTNRCAYILIYARVQ